MTANTRVSFFIKAVRAYGTTVSDEVSQRILVAVDPQYMQGSQGVLSVVIWIPVTSLTVVP